MGNARLYAQTKFRLGSLSVNDENRNLYEESTLEKVDNLQLGIGITDYKQFVGTNLNQKAIDIIESEGNRNFLSGIIG